ncbi:MAG: threonine--tRNA ligase [Firmicutes bacterium]|nr:threonine--tRNA ligase [Bacillota bacterium]
MKLILPDGKPFEVEKGKSGREVARAISISLEKKALAYSLDGVLHDLDTVIPGEGQFALITEKSQEASDLLNHSTSHLLAQAVQHLYPKALFGFGPSIEYGFYYDIDFNEPISEEQFPKIEEEMLKLSHANLPIVRKDISRQEALVLFKDNPYKVELIKEILEPISIYTQGDFFDLCHGPHVPSTGFIKHFKLLSIAGAYWRGDSKNKQLVRIYGTSFFSDEALKKHLSDIEERKKRDHRKLGRELGLFMISDFGPGFPFWLPNGLILRKTLENFWYDIHTREGYVFVQTPIMLSKELWEVSGHWANYNDAMYTSKIDEKEFAIKPMNCPGGILIFKNELHSYKDLPIRMGELGLVHRHEASGALSGLFRVRAFTQDDAHIFCTKEQLNDEIERLLKLFDKVYSIFGLSYDIELSTRPEKKYIGDIAIWNQSEKILAEVCQKAGKKIKINPGDGAFYGPKLDFKIHDSMGRVWQCGTIQLDMNLPQRFDLTYVDQNNEKVRPIMLHRVVFGSIERFIGIITEHFGGAFPTWLAPVQIEILPVNNAIHGETAAKLKELFLDNGLRPQIDNSEEKLGYRLRNSQMMKIPYTLVIGDNEMKDGTVTYRLFGQKDQVTVKIEDFIALIKQDIKEKRLLKGE